DHEGHARNGRGLENGGQRKFHRELLEYAGDHLGGRQRVPSRLEEILVPAHRCTTKRVREDLSEDLLYLILGQRRLSRLRCLVGGRLIGGNVPRGVRLGGRSG